MLKVCPRCRERNPNINKHCGSCGQSLEQTTSQIFRQIDNRGWSFVAPQGNYGPVSIVTNQPHDIHHRPPLDLAPTLPPRKAWTLASQIKIAYGLISVAATFCTLFGTSFFDFFKYIPFVGKYHWWLLSFALILVYFGLKVLLDAYRLQANRRSFDETGMSVLQEDGKILRYNYRCVCPVSHCGGTMKPEKKLVYSKAIWEWVCCRNENHRMPYDLTQVDHAIKCGQLNGVPDVGSASTLFTG